MSFCFLPSFLPIDERKILTLLYQVTEEDIENQERAIADSEKTLAKIDVAEGQLAELREGSIDPFDDSLEILRETWILAVADTAEIQAWLRGGQDHAVSFAQTVGDHDRNPLSLCRQTKSDIEIFLGNIEHAWSHENPR